MPATKEGVVQTFTKGIQIPSNGWKASVLSSFNLRLSLNLDFDVSPAFPRIKIITQDFPCNQSRLSANVQGLSCIESGIGKCEPAPRKILTTGSWGSHHELVWDGITLARGGTYDVCYCDRISDYTCSLWVGIGELRVSGPDRIGYSNFNANPGVQFPLTIYGTELNKGDRARIVPEGYECTDYLKEVESDVWSSNQQTVVVTTGAPDASAGSGGQRRLAKGIIREWKSGPPTFSNSSVQWWNIEMARQGNYHVCWCGGQFASCVFAADFKVNVGTLSVVDRQDCEVTPPWILKECSKPCGGGIVTFRRDIRKTAKGGGTPCPSEDELITTETCNTEACPLARVDSVTTYPEQLSANEPFQLFVNGDWLDPDADRILLIAEGAACGKQQNHFGGASCKHESSSQQSLVCGNGETSIKVPKAGRYRVCVCDSSASLIQTFDGEEDINVGHNTGAGLESMGCASGKYYLLQPSENPIIQVGAQKFLAPSGNNNFDAVGNQVISTVHDDDENCDWWCEIQSIGPVFLGGVGASPRYWGRKPTPFWMDA